MQLLKPFFLLLILIGFVNCNSSNSSEKRKIKKNTIVKKKEVEKVVKKAWDSLNRKNTKSFLIAYGNQNKETTVLIKTKYGNIKLKLYNDTPIHRASFIFWLCFRIM